MHLLRACGNGLTLFCATVVCVCGAQKYASTLRRLATGEMTFDRMQLLDEAEIRDDRMQDEAEIRDDRMQDEAEMCHARGGSAK